MNIPIYLIFWYDLLALGSRRGFTRSRLIRTYVEQFGTSFFPYYGMSPLQKS